MAKRKKLKTTAKPRSSATPKIRQAELPANEPATQRTASTVGIRPLTFSNDMLKWMAIGFGLVILGMLLMAGGRGDDPTVYDEGVLYSFRKVTLAPLVILGGLSVVVYGTLKK